jgi:hypothetical protein
MEERIVEKPNYFLLSAVVVLLLIVLVLLVYYIRYRTSITPRADAPVVDRLVSINNSYLFASPVRAKAGGDLIRVTVFLLDDSGRGVFGKKIILKSLDNVYINPIQDTTDETGKAIFDISSEVVGTYNLDSYLDDLPLGKVKVVFD